MSITVRVPDAAKIVRTNALSYAVELRIRVDTVFTPFQRKILKTGVRVIPNIPCILCVGKSSKRPNQQHIVIFKMLGPEDMPVDLNLEVMNPTSRNLGHNTYSRLSVLMFAIPLVSVRLDLLSLERKYEDYRSKPRCPVSTLATTPTEKTLDLEVVASKLTWKPFSRDKRMISMIGVDASKHDVHRFTTANIVSCSAVDIYVDQVTSIQTTGSVYVTFVTQHSNTVLPETIAFRMLLQEQETHSNRITFHRYPDPSLCTPTAYGLKILSPKTFIVTPDEPIRLDIPVSYDSEGKYVGMFVPKIINSVSFQLITWKERQILSILVTSIKPANFSKGTALGEIHFIRSESFKTRKVNPNMANITRYTVNVVDPTPDLGRQQSETDGKTYQKKRSLASIIREFRRNTSDTRKKRKIDEPVPERTNDENHDNQKEQGEHSGDHNDPEPSTKNDVRNKALVPIETETLVDIVPSGALFKLKHLVPLLLHQPGVTATEPLGLPKKIAKISSVEISGCWQPEAASLLPRRPKARKALPPLLDINTYSRMQLRQTTAIQSSQQPYGDNFFIPTLGANIHGIF
uniref:Protein UL84 n=1 Tax=Mastomys natalensis cytomegalovirus 2 TaxID=2973540 RepID=A0A9Y1ILT5_9BETA|nr:protein UL84 [Mastomys natalensis cytomegalovirus 2]WEG69219.1 protein UL84 [Mastomys natalensis cytomegalovirus 2]WEG69358.1 protein UL84 [Mastomys natalensis cytomegalovirus 2]WEG69496.1 protein UL84 [Mastomys natalensis cytomegalovirus 2]WEG69634.1 protein UL84 [Mastomys natalensis cytomegalovirus 2]